MDSTLASLYGGDNFVATIHYPMLPYYQPQADKNIYRLSNGLELHSRDQGRFEVRGEGNQKSFFSDLTTATLFYLRYPGAAAIFDVTEDEQLIERKVQVILS